jgi:hypothetical protein
MKSTASFKRSKTLSECLIEQGVPDKAFEACIDGLRATRPRKKRVKGKWIIEFIPDYKMQQKFKNMLLKLSKGWTFDVCSDSMKVKVRKVLSELENEQ